MRYRLLRTEQVQPSRQLKTQRLRDSGPAPILHHREERGIRALPDVRPEIGLRPVEDVLIVADRLQTLDEAVEGEVGARIFQSGDRQVRGNVTIDRTDVGI